MAPGGLRVPIELEMNPREVFTITAMVPYLGLAALREYADRIVNNDLCIGVPISGLLSRGLLRLRDCEIFVNLRF